MFVNTDDKFVDALWSDTSKNIRLRQFESMERYILYSCRHKMGTTKEFFKEALNVYNLQHGLCFATGCVLLRPTCLEETKNPNNLSIYETNNGNPVLFCRSNSHTFNRETKVKWFKRVYMSSQNSMLTQGNTCCV